jgi:hypothetical protein
MMGAVACTLSRDEIGCEWIRVEITKRLLNVVGHSRSQRLQIEGIGLDLDLL